MADIPKKRKFFFMKSAQLTKNKDGKKRYAFSSTNFDRDGDNMEKELLDSFVDQINNGHVAFFADHGMGPNGWYSFKDKLGQWEDAIVEKDIAYATPVFRNKPITPDLEMVMEIFDSNIAITLSIGFDPGVMEENNKGGLSFKTGELWEISAVGLPANADATSGMSMAKSYIDFYKKFISKNTTEADIMTEEEKNAAKALKLLKEQNAQLEAEVAKLQKAAKGEEEDGEEEKTITLDAIKEIMTESNKTVVEAMSAVTASIEALSTSLKGEDEDDDDDEDEEKGEDEDDEEEEKGDKGKSKKPKKGFPAPKGKGPGGESEGKKTSDAPGVFKAFN